MKRFIPVIAAGAVAALSAGHAFAASPAAPAPRLQNAGKLFTDTDWAPDGAAPMPAAKVARGFTDTDWAPDGSAPMKPAAVARGFADTDWAPDGSAPDEGAIARRDRAWVQRYFGARAKDGSR